jgi:predicted amino acid dehydrogenase
MNYTVYLLYCQRQRSEGHTGGAGTPAWQESAIAQRQIEAETGVEVKEGQVGVGGYLGVIAQEVA